MNGNGDNSILHSNGVDSASRKRAASENNESQSSVNKRPAPDTREERDGPAAKRGKTFHKGGVGASGDDLIVLDDTDGAIVIDDD